MIEDNSKREYPVDPDALARLEVCQKCKFFEPKTEENPNDTCGICGCMLKIIINRHGFGVNCPIGKW